MNNSDMPAMPQSDDTIEQWNDSTDPSAGTYFATGLTKREHFAGLAMQGLLSNANGLIQANSQAGFANSIAELAFSCADALLAKGVR